VLGTVTVDEAADGAPSRVVHAGDAHRYQSDEALRLLCAGGLRHGRGCHKSRGERAAHMEILKFIWKVSCCPEGRRTLAPGGQRRKAAGFHGAQARRLAPDSSNLTDRGV